MKKYKLLKDLPNCKAGTIFESYSASVKFGGLLFFEEEMKSNPDFFELVKEPMQKWQSAGTYKVGEGDYIYFQNIEDLGKEIEFRKARAIIYAAIERVNMRNGWVLDLGDKLQMKHYCCYDGDYNRVWADGYFSHFYCDVNLLFGTGSFDQVITELGGKEQAAELYKKLFKI